MKNQYFGDIRDLFKYDLISWILKENSINRFTFIPMLTRNDSRSDGNKIDYSKAKAGVKNKELLDYLRKRVRNDRRNIVEIKDYFERNGVEIKIFCADCYFDHQTRYDYFNGIRDELLSSSLIFVDPDNGLEVKRPNEKHILYDELKELYNRMKRDSILMVYQHFSRENHGQYLRRRSKVIEEKTRCLPVFIHDNEIIFFFLTKNDAQMKKVSESVVTYRDIYPNLLTGNTI